jgi:putative oxidoreductase
MSLYRGIFGFIQRVTEDWLLGITVRLIFASTLLVYFLDSAMTKVGNGFPDNLHPTIEAYRQILPLTAEQVSYDLSRIQFFPDGLIVYAGTYAEFAFPIMIVVGLWTRLASLGMIIFIVVMTYVQIYAHQVDAAAIGRFFDVVPDSTIADQRLLWLMPLLYLVIRGPGFLSLDTAFGGTSSR